MRGEINLCGRLGIAFRVWLKSVVLHCGRTISLSAGGWIMITMTRRTALGGLSALISAPLFAQPPWPNRPIKLVVGFPAGGPVDTVSRIVGETLSRRLGQPIVVENKPGATGTIAAAQVAHATPDGYTLTVLPGTFAASAAMFRKLPYDPLNDFSWISTIAEFPYLMATYSGHPCASIADLVSNAKSTGTPLHFGTSGVGSVQHLSGELLASIAGIKLQHVPYRGGMPAITDLLGKRLDLVIDQPTTLLEFIRDGRLRALAVTDSNRFFALPDVVTVSEAGFPDYHVTSWQGLAGPAGLAPVILDRLNSELAGILAEPQFGERLRALGDEPKISAGEAFKARVASDIDVWTKVVADADIERN
jgi:tripartite-type tricarboxylate transporter receptor subunit TctC